MAARAEIVVSMNVEPRRVTVRGFTLSGAPGLAVTENASPITGGWRVTHIASGMSLPAWFAQAVDAARFALNAAKSLDWSAPAPDPERCRAAFGAAVRAMYDVPRFYTGHQLGREDRNDETPLRWQF